MDLSLAGKRALVCGSTQGIGKAAAVELALLGAEITLLARNPDKLRAVADELPRAGDVRHHWVAADLGDVAAVQEGVRTLHERGGTYHVLVNNTGGPPGGTAIDAPPQAYIDAFTAHLIASQLLTQCVVPGMKADGFGRIINIISTSVKAPIANLGVSNTIRGAVASWAKTLAGELAPYGITVNNVLPGYTETDRLTSLVAARAAKSGASTQLVEKELLAGIPAGRFAKPQELGAAVAFLASPAAAYINGINLPVDGGRLPTL